MSALVKYRRFTALCLFLLYVFIAAPVQLWHHHAGSQQGNDKYKQCTVSVEKCKICNHHYSVYYLHHIAAGAGATLVFRQLLQLPVPQPCRTVLSHLPNKGPPFSIS
ncbi:hypothetical protein [Chitinophaga tropicalis]|uniref:Uncharacterized protein n=1 Tax=Chitinophaga tropicalis TaxID=2683588 RepID=A0A7K1U6K7_9BACT|nr:hypothetical protein [Chitinophaga tropicalis]MVT09987.1 hypothetical protein [Chitinophaga tropicalis]